ncbi:MAG: hypothetical protein LQ340_001092 [Diploschistes diacapsis]|nr:MAG: hypothetical protein LQ340_001092 [Diploschistes diacapsis]
MVSGETSAEAEPSATQEINVAQPQRRPNHTPSTSSTQEESYYVLTLQTDRDLHEKMSALRMAHFPKALNVLDAHITIFHALPGSKLEQIEADIQKIAEDTFRYKISTAKPFQLSRGIAIHLYQGKGDTRHLRKRFRNLEWFQLLSEQDRKDVFEPHFTIKNKVADRKLRKKSLEEVNKTLEAEESGCFRGVATGLRLWLYREDGWTSRAEWSFRTRNISSVVRLVHAKRSLAAAPVVDQDAAGRP